MILVVGSFYLSKLPITSAVCLNVGPGMLISALVDFDPITADVAPSTIWHPYRVLSALWTIAYSGCGLEIEIQLSRLIRLGPGIHDGGFGGTVHKQCHTVHARLQSV